MADQTDYSGTGLCGAKPEPESFEADILEVNSLISASSGTDMLYSESEVL